MADGKQWYNSPQGPDKKKAGGKPVNPAKKGAKPVGKSSGAPVSGQAGKKPVKSSGSPVNGKPVKGRPMNGKPVAKAGQQTRPGQPVKSSHPVKNGQPVKQGQTNKQGLPVKNAQQAKQGQPVKKQNKGLFGFKKANKKPDPFVAEYKKAHANADSDKSIIPEMNAAVQATSKDQSKLNDQNKVMEQVRLKEQAKIKEQKKIEKNEYTRKNPAQKSAESRAIRNGILGAVAVAAALFVLVFVVHHL